MAFIFSFLPILMVAQMKWIWQNSLRQNSWFNWLISGDIKVSCLFLVILNKSEKYMSITVILALSYVVFRI